jgi:hypothetical protein
MRPDLREPAFRQVGIALVEGAGDGELEDAVAEELEPLVRLRSIGSPRRVREGVVEPLAGKLLDQRPQSAGCPRVGAATTGAT